MLAAAFLRKSSAQTNSSVTEHQIDPSYGVLPWMAVKTWEKNCEKIGARPGVSLHCLTPFGTLPADGVDIPGRKIGIFSPERKAGDRTRTGDVQLGKLTFYH
jgi:hypothetical protein